MTSRRSQDGPKGQDTNKKKTQKRYLTTHEPLKPAEIISARVCMMHMVAQILARISHLYGSPSPHALATRTTVRQV